MPSLRRPLELGLHATVTVVDEAIAVWSVIEGLLERIQREIRLPPV
jgi:hypothetical protein